MASAPITAQEIIPNPDPSARTSAQIEAAIANSEAKISTRVDGIEKAIEVHHQDLVRVPTLLDRAVLAQKDLFEARIARSDDALESMRVLLSVHEALQRVPLITKDAIEQSQYLFLSNIAELRATGDGKFAALDQRLGLFQKALDGRDQAILLHLNPLQELLVSKITELRSIMTEKFIGIDNQFSGRDLALTAAFAAAKEATGKIEAGFTKSIDEQAKIMAAGAGNAEGKISDLKDRITALESRGQGASNLSGYLFAAIGALAGLAGLAVAIAVAVTRH